MVDVSERPGGFSAHVDATSSSPQGQPSLEGNGPQCLAVMYHYVHDVQTIRSTGIRGLNRAEFRAQLDQLCRTMEPIDWPTLYAWFDGRASIPGRCFLLTFDDGLADHAECVLPILQECGLRGVFFVPGSVLATHRLLSAHMIHMLLSTLGEEPFFAKLVDRLDRTEFNAAWRASIDSATAEAMYHYEPPTMARLKYLLTVALPIDARQQVLDELFERHVGSSKRWSREWYLTWDNLVEMQSLGHTIGGHGYTHESLARLTQAERRDDLRRSAAILRDGLGPDHRPLSYPYGRFDDATTDACRAAGFAHAFTTEKRWIDSGCDRLRLPRFDTIDVEKILPKEAVCQQSR